MECNKEEALKAKQIAELKVAGFDFAGAKRFALKAQNLYPELDGLPQFLATLDVYTSAEKGANGEVNWYKVLGVDPLADEDTIQKQFRKLALRLHPDKNKSAGAEGAFKIIYDARRILYDRKQILSSMHDGVPDGKSSMPTTKYGFQMSATPTMPCGTTMPDGKSSKPTTQNGFQFFKTYHSNTRDQRSSTPTMPDGKSSMPTTQNGFQFFKTFHSNTRDQRSSTPTMPDGKSSMPTTQNSFQFNNYHSSTRDERSATPTKPLSTSRPQKGRKTTFWTICSCCKMYFEYLRMFLTHELQCHNCHNHFIAYKIPAPKNASKSRPFDPQQQIFSQPTIPNNSCDPGRTPAAAADVRSSGISGVNKPMFAPGWTHAPATDVRSSGISGVDKPMFAPGWTHAAATDVRSSGISGVDKPMLAPGWTHAAARDVRSSGISGLCFNSATVESMQATAFSSSQAAGSAHPAFGQLNRGHEESFPYKEAHQWKFHAFKKPDPFLSTVSPNAGFSAVPSGVEPIWKRHRWQEMQTKVGMGNGGVDLPNISRG